MNTPASDAHTLASTHWVMCLVRASKAPTRTPARRQHRAGRRPTLLLCKCLWASCAPHTCRLVQERWGDRAVVLLGVQLAIAQAVDVAAARAVAGLPQSRGLCGSGGGLAHAHGDRFLLEATLVALQDLAHPVDEAVASSSSWRDAQGGSCCWAEGTCVVAKVAGSAGAEAQIII